jgi:hypothetical protein
MTWFLKGQIFDPTRHGDGWITSHASQPTADPIDDNRLRIHFATRDDIGRSRPTSIDVDPASPQRILDISRNYTLDLGPLGAFDDSGVMPSSIVACDGRKFFYYTGWNRGKDVPYRLAIGLAISEGNDQVFQRISPGPILDRGIHEPYFCASPSVLRRHDGWRMWYVSCSNWIAVSGRPEPKYHIKFARSKDGVDWICEGRVCLDYDDSAQAYGRPWVIYEDDRFKMYYSYRGIDGYRKNTAVAYRLGYAESTDGEAWIRRDDQMNIVPAQSGWNAVMNSYPCVYRHDGRRFLVFNGDGFGRTGFGYAEAEERPRRPSQQ